MKRHYNFVYLTNTPSFYKLNLCNEICRTGRSVLLVLYGYGSEAVNTELTDGKKNCSFDFVFLHDGDSHRRRKSKTFWRLLKLMHSITYDRVLFSGWLASEYNIYAFLSPKHRNAVICESSIHDISLKGIAGLVKKAIIGRMSYALPSGVPHQAFFDSIGFRGQSHITGSVGIFYKPGHRPKLRHTPLRYIFVGRLIDVKCPGMLIDEFNRTGRPLTIVGAGPLDVELKARAKSNIIFTGFIDNESLGRIYQDSDVFILPSKYEPWGLVVEEALYWGLPVIVSSRVGSADDMVKNLGTGIIFESQNPDSLHSAIEQMEKEYNKYVGAVDAIDWQQRDRNQVDAYLKILDKR